MATIDCNACAELISDAPEFMARGVTDTVCDSLKNNTGLNPSLSVLHDNCEDFERMNDCLIGKKAIDIKSYSDCDWKAFAKDFIQNLYQYLKALNCSECGQWGILAAMSGSVGGNSFVRYYRDNSGTGSGYEWAATVGANHALDIYMDADLDGPLLPSRKPVRGDRDHLFVGRHKGHRHHPKKTGYAPFGGHRRCGR